MKKTLFIIACAATILSVASCKNNKKAEEPAAPAAPAEIAWTAALPDTVIAHADAPEYTLVRAAQVDLASLKQDADGAYILFDGTTLDGWRGYGKDTIPSRWTLEDGAIKFTGSHTGEGQTLEGGDIIFAHNFRDFELSLEWKVAEGGNSGIFYLAQEVKTKDPSTGADRYEPIYVSCPEYQVLDNERHPDAKLGVDGNRMSASLYDMIPAKPQNSKPAGEWNTARIMVYEGTVVHYQNDEKVLEYHLWTPQWTDMLQGCKFSQKAWPIAFELLNNCGGENHEGYIGMQDHGDDVWYRNIKVKLLK